MVEIVPNVLEATPLLWCLLSIVGMTVDENKHETMWKYKVEQQKKKTTSAEKRGGKRIIETLDYKK